MVSNRWIANASPLILLGKTDNLDLLGALANVIAVPQAVVNEIGAKSDGTPIVQLLNRKPPFSIVNDEVVSTEILSWDLGAGETQVIANAQRYGADRVVIDDMEARRCARSMGFQVIGTLGVVGRAKSAGKIQRAAPIIKRLCETGMYVSKELVQLILKEVGE